jgi:malate/lactate dehydrogenase
MNILLIGCGGTGSAIAAELVKRDNITTIQLYNRSVEKACRLEETLGSSKVSIVESIIDASLPDFIVVAVSGMNSKTREKSVLQCQTTFDIRQREMLHNIGSIGEVVEDLSVANFSGSRIFVLTNPVDEFTNLMRIMLPNNDVIGFGMSLDAARYSATLGREVFCIGEHGHGIPLVGLGDIAAYERLYAANDQKLMDRIRMCGIPHEFVGNEFGLFFDYFTGARQSIVHASYYLEESFLGVAGLSMSAPFYASGGVIRGHVDVKASETERFLFNKQAISVADAATKMADFYMKFARRGFENRAIGAYCSAALAKSCA